MLAARALRQRPHSSLLSLSNSSRSPAFNTPRHYRNTLFSPTGSAAARVSAPQVLLRAKSTSAAPTSQPSQEPPDHRKLGLHQNLYTTSIYSPGSPILLPHGTRIFNRLVEFLRKQYVRYGFDEVITPTIYKKSLWERSGHLENYADDMFTVTASNGPRAHHQQAQPTASDPNNAMKSGAAPSDGSHSSCCGDRSQDPDENEEYGLKPMNCPGHCLIFASQPRSYKDLPIRYADFSPLHRNEVSGALSGLTRVRRFHQDDGHIFCRPSQIYDEIRNTLDFVRDVYKTLHLGPYRLTLSTRPADHYIGTPEEWEGAEQALRSALDASGQDWSVNEGDGAFYGPKIDIILRDSHGKEHQTATVQLDFQLPKRFDLSYVAPAPKLEKAGQMTSADEADTERHASGPVTPVLIHRAVLGSVERLMALLIEHYNGRWPLWLNPRQVAILAINDTEPVVALARSAQDTLLGRDAGAGGPALSNPSGLTVDLDLRSESLAVKKKQAIAAGYSVIAVVGSKQVDQGTLTVDMAALRRLDEASGRAPQPSGAQPRSQQQDMLPKQLLDELLQRVRDYA